ncbi:glycosyltransferase family 2 protein [Vibrio parahaemolyticus]|uniref:glycosyltransferase family 2 protein n=1 Tax=Vibrio parahaemolyticus TaxID=670 RepID=UPI003892B049
MISIVVPYYNRIKSLCITLDSLVNQCFRDFEVVVVDDGSERGSIESDLKNKYPSLNLKYHYFTNNGVSVARNIGAGLSSGEYLLFLDAGDLYHPQHLDLLYGFLKTEPTNLIATTFVQVLDANVSTIVGGFGRDLLGLSRIKSYSKFIDDLLIDKEPIHICSVIIKKELFNSIGGFSKRFTMGEDVDFILRAVEHNKLIKIVDSKSFFYILSESESVTLSKVPLVVLGQAEYIKSKNIKTSSEKEYLAKIYLYMAFINVKNKNFPAVCKNILGVVTNKVLFRFIILLFNLKSKTEKAVL